MFRWSIHFWHNHSERAALFYGAWEHPYTFLWSRQGETDFVWTVNIVEYKFLKCYKFNGRTHLDIFIMHFIRRWMNTWNGCWLLNLFRSIMMVNFVRFIQFPLQHERFIIILSFYQFIFSSHFYSNKIVIYMFK